MKRLFVNEKKKKSLITKHHKIDQQIKNKSKILCLDSLEINTLKKKKLYIKDKIVLLK
tara:strand:+ start:1011 stop:1184 length:174 start_codon:yes stop_codon:yes gene_type:complete